MAGVKGKSGGKRDGAGRPAAPKPPEAPVVKMPEGCDMLEFLQKVALGQILAAPLQVRAAIAAVQYTHTKRADGGKKKEAAEKAQQVAQKFRTSAPPLKVVSNG